MKFGRHVEIGAKMMQFKINKQNFLNNDQIYFYIFKLQVDTIIKWNQMQLALKSSKNEYAVVLSLNRWRWGRALFWTGGFGPSIDFGLPYFDAMLMQLGCT